MDFITEAKHILDQEAKSICEVADKLDDNFVKAVELLHGCQGKVIVTGIGKSGIIGRKIASTLASAGTPAFFMHSSEAIHGDIGMVTNQDVVIIVSNSGETSEILNLLPALNLAGVRIIGIIGNPCSTAAQKCDICLDATISKEVDSNNLVPTSSTAAAMALGDALAIVLAKHKKLEPKDFALKHPGGTLGKRLTWTVEHLMYKGDKIPKVLKSAFMKEVIFIFTKIGLGIVAVVDEKDYLLGVFTDGDLRRLIEREKDFVNIEIAKVMNPNPKSISANELAFNALARMKDFRITALIVVDENNKVAGVINLHDILKAGIA